MSHITQDKQFRSLNYLSLPNQRTNYNHSLKNILLKTISLTFMFSEATKIDEIFAVNLTLCSKHQIDCEDFVIFCGLLRKYEL